MAGVGRRAWVLPWATRPVFGHRLALFLPAYSGECFQNLSVQCNKRCGTCVPPRGGPNTAEQRGRADATRFARAFDTRTASGKRAAMPDMMLRAASLEALPNLRHAFFTRHGGASGGLYASLNGGVGPRAAPRNNDPNPPSTGHPHLPPPPPPSP